MKDERLTIFLSPGELFCIAGTLGFPSLPLVGSHYRGYTPEQIRDDVNRGREVLESRGLIKRSGLRNWEVDGSLSTLVESIARPEYCLVLSSWRKDEPNLQVFLYVRKGQGLSVIYQNRFFNLSVYREVKQMSKFVQGWMGISAQPSAGVAEFVLPAVDLRTLQEKIWQKPDLAPAALQEAGVPEGEALRLAETLLQIEHSSNLTLLVPEGDRFSRQGQLLLVNNPMNMWSNETIKTSPEPVRFVPTPSGRAVILVDRYLRGRVGQTEAEAAEDGEFL